jgi:hypothetical protein
MTTTSDLPIAAIKRITQLARGRIIHGCNGYAIVSRQWRDAGDSSSSSQESEQLQLFLARSMDLADMSEAAINRALAWLARHGKQADVLVIASGLPPSVPPDSMYTSVAALSYLRRLELMQQHSLVRLAPVLDQLPQLQHLEAHVSMVCHPDFEAYMEFDAGDGEGIFVDWDGNQWMAPPDLQQQLCPQLTHPRLLIEPSVDALWLDEQLPVLLPARLKQLELVGINNHVRSWVQSYCLSHLTALQQLTIQRIDIEVEDVRSGQPGLEEHLAGVQQLRVIHPRRDLGSSDGEQLAPKIIDYSTRLLYVDEWALTGLVSLTRLPLGGTASLAAATASLAALQLQELVLTESSDDTLLTAAELAAGMPTLRSLQLHGDVGVAISQEQLSAALVQCTQLTALGLAVSLPPASAYPTCYMAVPQQLTGLQHLTVPAELLEQEAGAWL